MEKAEKIEKIKEIFEARENVAFAYLFGSQSSGMATSESDFDIAVYFIPKTAELEWEAETEHEAEDKIWLELEREIGKRVDLVVLNRAPSNIAYDAIQRGEPIFVRDNALLWRFFLAISSAAEDMRDFVKDFVAIRERSRSMTEIDKERIRRLAVFLETEIHFFATFKNTAQLEYQQDISVKRNMERWAENVVNSSIDIAKILLASEKKAIPETYRAILAELSLLHGFDPSVSEKLARFAKIRNLLAHEYLDIRFKELKFFASEGEDAYKFLVEYAKNKLKE